MSTQLTVRSDRPSIALRWSFCSYCNENVAVVVRQRSSINQIRCPICGQRLLQELHFQTAPTSISYTYGFPTPAAILGGGTVAFFSAPLPGIRAFPVDVHNLPIPHALSWARFLFLGSHNAPNPHNWMMSFAGEIHDIHIPTFLVSQFVESDLQNDRNVYGPPPAARSAVEALPDEKMTGETEASIECVVCLDDFVLNQEATRLPCSHIYHKECILPWLALHNTCPKCRRRLPAEDTDYQNRDPIEQTSGNREDDDEASTAL